MFYNFMNILYVLRLQFMPYRLVYGMCILMSLISRSRNIILITLKRYFVYIYFCCPFKPFVPCKNVNFRIISFLTCNLPEWNNLQNDVVADFLHSIKNKWGRSIFWLKNGIFVFSFEKFIFYWL